jgi:hypothetical protein
LTLTKLSDDQRKVTINMKIDPNLLRGLQEFCQRTMASRSAASVGGPFFALENTAGIDADLSKHVGNA